MTKKNERLEFPTLAIQLSNDIGLPYDMPDDWLEFAFTVVNMIYAKYNCGMDLLYGMATKEGFEILDEEVNK